MKMLKSILTAAVALALPLMAAAAGAPSYDCRGIEVYFSPNGGAQDAIVRQIAGAKKEILVQAFHFSNTAIIEALIAAQKRGVHVTAVLDTENRHRKSSGAPELAENGVTVLIDDEHHTAHNKLLLIDGATVITGSFNYNKNAESNNAENILVLPCEPLAKRYIENFEAHRGHSDAWTGLQPAAKD